MMPEMVMVSQISESVSLAMRLMVLLVESSVTMAVSAMAVGAVLEHAMVIVPVALFERDPDPSCTW